MAERLYKQSGGVALARYILRARGASGPVEFQERLTIDQALDKAPELRDAHFSHIAIYNVLSGVEITDLEALMGAQGDPTPSSAQADSAPQGDRRS